MENLPVVVKKGRGQLEALAKPRCKQRLLCPYGKLLAVLDADEVIKVHSFSNANTQCSIDSDRFKSISWISKISKNVSPDSSTDSPEQSYLLALSLSNNIHLFQVGHAPFLTGNSNEDNIEPVDEGLSVALLPYKSVSSMSNKQISSILSKAQLGKDIHALFILGTSETGNIVLIANGNGVLHLSIDMSSSPTSRPIMVSSVFTIEPNMSIFDSDLLPQYVSKLTHVQMVWPLLFTLTEDGIVLVYSLTSTACICAINPVEYCRLFHTQPQDSENILQRISSSNFTNLSVSPDLMKLSVFTSTHDTIFVHLPNYFKHFPDHYPRAVPTKSPLRSSQMKVSIQASKAAVEEEDELLKYGGLTKKQSVLGTAYKGPFVGHFVTQKSRVKLKEKIGDLNLASSNHGLNLEGTISLEEERKKTLIDTQDSSLKWYEPTLVNDSRKGDYMDTDRTRPASSASYSSSFGRRSSATPSISSAKGHARKPSYVNQTSNWSSYPFKYILPSPDTCVDKRRAASDLATCRLLYADCGNSMVIAYYCSGTDYQPETGFWNTGTSLEHSISYIAVYNVIQQTYIVVKLPVINWLILPTRADKPVYLVSEKFLSLAAFTLPQEDFVAKVLMYGSAAVAEEVCHLNRWDQCSLPLNALETALELRQLDTVSFFLRNRDAQSESKNGKAPISRPPPPLPPDQLDAAVDLLTNSIRRNHDSEHNRQFAGQLLGMTLNFLLRLNKSQTVSKNKSLEWDTNSKNGGSESLDSSVELPAIGTNNSNETSKVELGHPEKTNGTAASTPPPNLNVTSYIQALRQYIPKSSHTLFGQGKDNEVPQDRRDTESQEDGFQHVLNRTAVKESWDNKSPRDVIRQALIRGNLPLAHAYLINKSINGRPGLSDDGPNLLQHDVSLDGVISVGLGFIMEALSNRNYEQATSILTQMGANVKESMRFVFLHTVQRQLREFLAKHLYSNGWLTEQESNALDFLRVLESYYPLEDYKQAETLYQTSQSSVRKLSPPIVQRSESNQNDSLLSWMDEGSGSGLTLTGNITDHYPEYFGGDQAAIVTIPSVSPDGLHEASLSPHDMALYLQVPLYIVLEWDLVARQRILYEGILMSGRVTESSKHMVKAQHKVEYHISHHDPGAVRQQYSQQHTDGQSSSLEGVITVDLINSLTRRNQCSTYTRNLFMDDLAREGVYGTLSVDNLNDLLHQMGRVHSLFSSPHPLAVSNESGLVVVETFHRLFIHYLIEKKFIGLLYLYLDYYKLALDFESISIMGLDSPDLPPWVEYLVQCRLAAHNPSEPSRIFSASLSCSRLLKGSNNISECLSRGNLLMSLATMMYAPVSISECSSVINTNKPFYVDQGDLKQVLVPFPTLQAAIFPSKSKKLTSAESQDISVYQLLKGGVPFDVSRLFKWQKTNLVAAADDNMEESHEMPHFSQKHLSQKYALTVNLTYRYFLEHGQPSFALANFVASNLVNSSNPSKRIDKAIFVVYKMIMSDFTNPKLVSSCIAFIEMLSRDSTPMRIDSLAANRIYSYQQNKESNGGSSNQSLNDKVLKKKIGSQFIQLYQTPENQNISKALLRRLERATVHCIKSTKIDSCSTDAELLWNQVQMFCQCHSLPPSLEFLRECAVHGQWLPLLCHAQLHGVPPKEVLQVVEKNFSNAIAKEHLQLAISTMEMVSSPSLANGRSTVDERGRGRNRRRQMGGNTLSPAISRQQEKRELSHRDRAKFYSKFGVSTTPSVKEDTAAAVSSPQLDIDPMASMHVSSVSVIEPVNPNPPISADILPNDFFSVVFHCQDHPHPWQALLAYSIALERPLLALLAGCYDEASLIDCMCVWLCATLGCDIVTKVSSLLSISDEDEDGDLKFNGSLQWKRWNEDDFAYLLLVAMLTTTSQAVSQLPLLFHYFDKENPLYSFMKFREEFIVRFDLAECEQMLKDFSLQLDKCNRLGRNYLGRIGNIQWVEDIVVAFAGHMLVTCPTPFERYQLLKLLVECNFGEGFCCQQINDFHQLHEISSILEKANLSSIPAFKLTGEFNPALRPSSKPPSPLELYIVRTRIDGEHVLGVLIEKGQFDAAREYAKVAEVPIAKVTLKEAEFQYQKLADSSYWQYQPARFHFWQKCHKSFICDKVKPEAAAEFFEYVVQNSARLNSNEKTLLFVLALKWRKDGGLCAAEEEKKQEKQIWLSHINALKEETSEASQQSLNDLVTDPSISPTFYRHPSQGNPPLPILSALCISGQKTCTESFKLRQLVLPDDVPITVQKDGKSKLTKQESDVLDKVIGRLVNIGWIDQAQELATLFEHDSTDLTVVLCCIQLASNKLSPDQLTQDILNLLANQPPQRFIGQLHTTSEDSGDGGRANDNFRILKMMQQLSERAKNAQNCLYCIMTCLKTANVFHKPFSSVVMSDPFDTLAEILSSKYPDKYALARAFVNSTNMQPAEVAGFLSNCIAASLQSSTGGLPEEDYSRVKVYEPNMTTSQFMSLCALCSDHSRLGQMLLTMAKSYAGTENPSEECLVVQVELLIRSHDCYTLDCSVDGVAEILKVSRDITNVLYQGKHFKLMVRLLTGVGRFHEMMYIIHLLLECDEFESLVHPKVEKVEQLKVALMEYLRKHSRDSEKMEMVALKFEMYRELAQTREEKGQRELHKLKHKPLASSNFENVKVLKQIYVDFRDAAEIYAKDDCMSKSEHCLSQARLVALQLSVLSSGKRVLNLDGKAVQKFMEEQNFIEALVVANAYKKASLAEWVNPLYCQVVLNGNTRYLQDFTSVYPLTNSIMQDLASKFLLERSRSASMSNNMKKILEYCTSLTLKHKISSQLGLQESYSENLVNDGFLSDVTKL